MSNKNKKIMNSFEKRIIEECKYNATNNENAKNAFRADYEALASMLQNNMPKYADHLLGGFKIGLCPYMQFIGIEALKREDLPNNIAENGIYIQFKIDMADKTIEVHSWGHIYLSKEEQKATYLAMTGIKNVAKARGTKWFRKQKYKDITDLYNKIVKFYENVMQSVEDYTGGYPYKQGIGWVDPSKN